MTLVISVPLRGHPSPAGMSAPRGPGPDQVPRLLPEAQGPELGLTHSRYQINTGRVNKLLPWVTGPITSFNTET